VQCAVHQVPDPLFPHRGPYGKPPAESGPQATAENMCDLIDARSDAWYKGYDVYSTHIMMYIDNMGGI